jgi:hypothetical protein
VSFTPFAQPDTMKFNSLSFNTKTGTFSGSSTAYSYDPETGKINGSLSVPYQGIVYRSDGLQSQGYGAGYFVHSFNYYYFQTEPFRIVQTIKVLASGAVTLTGQ